MDIGWVSAIMAGPGVDPLDDEAVVLLPALPEEIEAYEQAHPGIEIQDLDAQNRFFQAVFQKNQCSVYDILSEDCSLRELNRFLEAAYQSTEEQFECGVRSLLALRHSHPDGKVHTSDMLQQAAQWETAAEQSGQELTARIREKLSKRRIPMNFFAQELKKIVGPTHPGATYSGRACYIKLGATNRAKLEFVTHGTADHYEALRVTVLNRLDGPVDKHTMLFRELIDVKGARDECFRRDIPYAWTYNGNTEWYAYQPTASDYRTMGMAVDEYLEVFQELGQHKGDAPAMGQQMS